MVRRVSLPTKTLSNSQENRILCFALRCCINTPDIALDMPDVMPKTGLFVRRAKKIGERRGAGRRENGVRSLLAVFRAVPQLTECLEEAS